ncbi:hypothetical protein H8356DRAFT_1363663 [Neocallimastix lanati (nom. inval.)]|nr:hypothetical protein H8356DRAFT_1363663 [Neocallimastix sp. JGI-2020a]
MEEAEHLCDRLAILVNDRLTCIVWEGYILELQTEDADQFQSKVVEGRNLFDSNYYETEKTSNNRVKYEVKMTNKFGSVFEKMEEYKKNENIKSIYYKNNNNNNKNNNIGVKCSIGNIYVPTVTCKEERKNAFSEITNWIKKHTNTPFILVGDFNM